MMGSEPRTEAADDQADLVNLTSVIPFLRRSAMTVLGTTALVTLVGLAYIAKTPVGYIARAELLIEGHKQPFFWNQAGLLDLTVDNAQVESEIEVLRSERIALAVISKLELTEDPELGGMNEVNEFRKTRATINSFLSRANARRIGQSYMIEVSFKSNDSEKAARIVNAITAAYLEDHLQAKIDAARRSNVWAERRISEVGVQLNAAATEVQKFKVAHGIVDATASQGLYVNTLTELEARVQSYRKLYESFLERLTQNIEQESYPSSAARVISAATTPLTSSFPKTNLVLLLSVAIGVLIGLALALVRQMLDHSVTSPKEIRAALGAECFGILPRYRRPPSRAWLYEAASHDPFSSFVEALRTVKVTFELVSRSGASLVLGVTSANSGEGKTTVAAGLATLAALSGQRSLLIDADFRQQSISRDLAPGNAVGLMEILRHTSDNPPDEPPPTAVRGTTGLHIIPASKGQAFPNSADTLGSTRMRVLLDQLRAKYHLIIIDLPAVNRVVDARAIGPFLDACLVVVEHRKTQIESLQHAATALELCRTPVVGAVLNKSDSDILPSLRSFVAGLWKRTRGFLSSDRSHSPQSAPQYRT